MKSYKLLTMSMLALAGASIVAPLRAATTSYAAGDLLLSFRDTGGYVNAAGTATTETYVVDLGNVSTVTSAGTHVLNSAVVGNAIGNIAADLANVFGAQWYNDPNLFWNISAVTGTVSNKTLYTTAQNPSTPWSSSNPVSPWGNNGSYVQASINSAAGLVGGIGNGYNNQTSATSNFGAVQVLGSNAQSYNTYVPASAGGTGANLLSTDKTQFLSLLTGSNEGNSATGITTNSLELYSINNAGGSGLDVGTFSINNSGQVTFSVGAVPEPGRASLLALGVGLLALRRRRKANAAVQG